MANKSRPTDTYRPGDWNAMCYQCGGKFKASELKRHWQGYYVCPDHWEPRHPQDFVRGVQDIQTPPWVQSVPQQRFVPSCDIGTISAVPGRAGPGCMIPGRPYLGDVNFFTGS